MLFKFTMLGVFTLITHIYAFNLRGCPSGVCHDTVEKPCCQNCKTPLQKFISVDHGFGHAPFCGETCIDPKKFGIYHLFEPNLTKAENISNPCGHQYGPNGRTFSHYNSTVTHGWPGVFSVTLDLYSQ